MLYLDPQNYRDVTARLFPANLAKDEPLVKAAFNAQFGVWNETPVQLKRESFHHHDPSRLLVRSYRGAIEARARPEVSDGQIAAWRDGIIDAIALRGSEERSDLLLCGVPVEYRWHLEKLGVVLHPAPAAAPRPPLALGSHPAMLRHSVSRHAASSVSSMIASRRLEQLSLLLNATTYLRCSHTMRVSHGWGWEPGTDSRSRWMTLTYYAPELHEPAAVGEAFERAPEGRWVEDDSYYIGVDSTVDGVAVLPASVEETLSAADALPEEHRKPLLGACSLIRQADSVALSSSSLSYVALVSAVETIAREWRPREGPSARFRSLLTDMLPQYGNVADEAQRLYALRCAIVHEGAVFPTDGVDMVYAEGEQEFAAFWALARVARLAVVNWVRVRSDLPKIPLAM